MEYIIVQANGPIQLQQLVNTWLAEGWVLHGNMIYTPPRKNYNEGEPQLLQPMIRTE